MFFFEIDSHRLFRGADENRFNQKWLFRSADENRMKQRWLFRNADELLSKIWFYSKPACFFAALTKATNKACGWLAVLRSSG